jgi:tetratricopeptide (TPR) repeat protein
MKPTMIAIGAALLLSSPTAWSMGGDDSPAADPTYRAATKLIAQHRFTEAVPLLKQVLARDPHSADAYNELGFVSRKLGDRAAALDYYAAALKLDPRHLGATEYLGELYAESGDLPHAEAQLARVAELCHSKCEAFADLEAAIQHHQPGKAGG